MTLTAQLFKVTTDIVLTASTTHVATRNYIIGPILFRIVILIKLLLLTEYSK